jgi:hypothetical protein
MGSPFIVGTSSGSDFSEWKGRVAAFQSMAMESLGSGEGLASRWANFTYSRITC